MGRRSFLAASVGGALCTLNSIEWAEAFKTQRVDDAAFTNSFGAQAAMVELQWGSDYIEVPPTAAEDGSFDYIFSHMVEGTVVSGEHEGIHDLSEDNSCAAISMGVEGLEQGQILKLVDISDANECQAICSKTLQCQAAQFNHSDLTCVLLKSFTGLTKALNTVVILASCDSDCFNEGEKLSGGGSSLGTVPNANLCQALCASNAACKGFTFRKSSKECLSFPDDTDLSPDEDAISGSKTSCTPHVQATNYTGSCSIPNMSGTNLPELEVIQNIDSYEQCRKLCLTNPKCRYLTFNSGDRRCYVKPGEGLLRYMKPGDTTGPRLCDGSCFLENIELVGQPLRTIQDRRSAHFCHYDCLMDASCTMWSFNEEADACSLYAQSSDLTGRHSAGVWTGPKSACPMEALYEYSAPRCSLRGVKFENEEPLKSTTTETAQACANECANSPNCEAFAYNVQQKKCDHLLAIAESRKENDVNYISGANVCTPSCFRQNTGYTGTELESFTDGFETAEQCQLRCQATVGCTSWNFLAAQRACKLLNGGSTKSATGTVGGTKYCDGACDIPGYTLNPFGYSRSVTAANKEACRVQCKNDSKCRAMTFSSGCTLYDEFAFGRMKALQNASTGFPSCSACFREGAGYQVDEVSLLWTTDTHNAEECRIRCSLMEYCTRFTYNAKTRACSLLSGESGEIKGTYLVSGPASCQQASTACFKTNTAYAGGKSVGQETAQTLEQCQQMCEQQPTCRVFNFQSSSKACQLFTAEGVSIQAGQGSTAGKKKCMVLSSEVCPDNDKDYYGSDLHTSPYRCDNATCCRDLCANDVRCKTWMFFATRNDCWLKKLDAYTKSRNQASTTSGAHLGCPYCARMGRTYSGTVLSTEETTNQAMCQLECQLQDDCRFFTFGPGKSCKLYSDEGTVTQTGADAVYSGPREC
ncbi:hypothetical protein ACSSS7_001825 [Eimeria intestinalis]